MKLFGSLTELVSTVFRKNSQAITLRPNQAVTYTASRDIQTPPQDADSILVSADATQTLTNKTISGASNTLSNVNLASQVTGILPAANGGTGIANNAASTLTISGNFATTLTVSGGTSVTLPTTGTLATLAGSETLTNKNLASTTNTLTGATAGSFTNTGTVTLPTATDTLVGRATTDTLTNKDIDGGTASNARRITLPKDTTGNLNGLTRKQGTIVYDTSTNQVKYDDGSTLTALASGGTATPTTVGSVSSYFATIQSAVKTIATGDWVTNAFSVTTTDGYSTFRCETGSTARTLNLPAAASNTGRVIHIKLIGTTPFPLTVDGNSSETIDGNTTYEVAGYTGFLTIVCNGTSWEVVAEGPQLKPSFRAYISSAQNIPDGVASNTEVVFATEDWDNGAYYNTTTGRFTPKVKGRYLIEGALRISNASVANGDMLRISLYKNGSVVTRMDSEGFAFGGGGNGSAWVNTSHIIELNGDTDYASIFATQETGLGTLALEQNTAHCWFQAHYLGKY